MAAAREVLVLDSRVFHGEYEEGSLRIIILNQSANRKKERDKETKREREKEEEEEEEEEDRERERELLRYV